MEHGSLLLGTDVRYTHACAHGHTVIETGSKSLASVDTATDDVVAAKIVDLILDCVVDGGVEFFSLVSYHVL